MVHRTKIVDAGTLTDPPESNHPSGVLRAAPHPEYRSGRTALTDNIMGILHAKDFAARNFRKNRGRRLRGIDLLTKFISPPWFVPDTRPVALGPAERFFKTKDRILLWWWTSMVRSMGLRDA